MNKKELTETIKIIYDALNEGKDSIEEIKKLKDELTKKNVLIKALIKVLIPYIKSSQFEICSEVTPYDLTKYIKDYMVLMHTHVNNEEIDDKYIDDVINWM